MLTTGLVGDGIIAVVRFACAIVLDGSGALSCARGCRNQLTLPNTSTGGHAGVFLPYHARQCLIYVFRLSIRHCGHCNQRISELAIEVVTIK